MLSTVWWWLGYPTASPSYPDISEYTDAQIRNISIDTYWKSRRVVVKGPPDVISAWDIYVEVGQLHNLKVELLIRNIEHEPGLSDVAYPLIYAYAKPGAMKRLADEFKPINKLLPSIKW